METERSQQKTELSTNYALSKGKVNQTKEQGKLDLLKQKMQQIKSKKGHVNKIKMNRLKLNQSKVE